MILDQDSSWLAAATLQPIDGGTVAGVDASTWTKPFDPSTVSMPPDDFPTMTFGDSEVPPFIGPSSITTGSLTPLGTVPTDMNIRTLLEWQPSKPSLASELPWDVQPTDVGVGQESSHQPAPINAPPPSSHWPLVVAALVVVALLK